VISSKKHSRWTLTNPTCLSESTTKDTKKNQRGIALLFPPPVFSYGHSPQASAVVCFPMLPIAYPRRLLSHTSPTWPFPAPSRPWIAMPVASSTTTGPHGFQLPAGQHTLQRRTTKKSRGFLHQLPHPRSTACRNRCWCGAVEARGCWALAYGGPGVGLAPEKLLPQVFPEDGGTVMLLLDAASRVPPNTHNLDNG
jgi:hypothetical protein